MIFVVASDDSGLSYRTPVLSKEGDRRRIEVDPIRLQAEKLDRAKGELEEDAPTPVFRELIEGPSNPIVIDGEFLVLRQSQGPGVDRFDPFAQTVEGVPRNKHVMHEHPNGFTVSELPVTAAVDVLVEDASYAELFQEELNQGMGTEPVDFENLSPCTLQETPHTGGRSRTPFCCHGGLFYNISDGFQSSRSSSKNTNSHKR